MTSPVSRFRVNALLALAMPVLAFAADTPRGREGAANPATPATQRTTRSSTARGPLPDPLLLDGSAQKADKQSEDGMLGEFEIPGDENVRNGRIGGPENASPQATDDASLPQNGGSAQGTRTEGQPGGGGQPGGPENPQAQQGGAAGGGSADQKAGQIPGGGDPNAQAQGIQVAELQGQPQGGGGPADMAKKPPPMPIGDSAMQIQGVQNAPSVVGGQVPGQTQQMEKAIGGGGKGASGNNGNRGAEKGRVMPAGL